MDYVLPITVGFIFLAALVGTFVSRRTRDRCLRDFEGFQTTVELPGNKFLWGLLEVFPKSLHLVYGRAHQDVEGHVETSYLILTDELAKVVGLRRYHDELTAKNQERRRRDIQRTHKPSLMRRGRRKARNFVNTFRDAFAQSLGAAMAQAKKGGSTVMAQDKQITQIGQTVLGSSANAFEPLLERYIDRRVVAEELRDGEWVEYPGILKEYTADWIQLLGCRLRVEETFDFADPERLELNRKLDFAITFRAQAEQGGTPSLTIEVENHDEEPVRLVRVEAADYVRELNTEAAPGETQRVELEDLPEAAFAVLDAAAMPREVVLQAFERRDSGRDATTIPALPAIRLVLEFTREADLCLPRRTVVVRHGAEPLE